jgi:hypothetical protein
MSTGGWLCVTLLIPFNAGTARCIERPWVTAPSCHHNTTRRVSVTTLLLFNNTEPTAQLSNNSDGLGSIYLQFLPSLYCLKHVHSRNKKLAALYIQIARQAVQSSSEFYDFFVALYLLFLRSHRYWTKQNRLCQLLLNVRMQWLLYTVPEANKIIDSLQSERSFCRVIREIQINFRCSGIAHRYNTWLGNYNSSDARFESTPEMISFLFVCLFSI